MALGGTIELGTVRTTYEKQIRTVPSPLNTAAMVQPCSFFPLLLKSAVQSYFEERGKVFGRLYSKQARSLLTALGSLSS